MFLSTYNLNDNRFMETGDIDSNDVAKQLNTHIICWILGPCFKDFVFEFVFVTLCETGC